MRQLIRNNRNRQSDPVLPRKQTDRWALGDIVRRMGPDGGAIRLESRGRSRDPVPVDAIPDIGENQQIVFTEWLGRSPQDVEDQITYPLTVSLLGIPGVKTIRSYSFFGFSSIYIIFEDGIDFYWSRSRILEKLNSLPKPTLSPKKSGWHWGRTRRAWG